MIVRRNNLRVVPFLLKGDQIIIDLKCVFITIGICLIFNAAWMLSLWFEIHRKGMLLEILTIISDVVVILSSMLIFII